MAIYGFPWNASHALHASVTSACSSSIILLHKRLTEVCNMRNIHSEFTSCRNAGCINDEDNCHPDTEMSCLQTSCIWTPGPKHLRAFLLLPVHSVSYYCKSDLPKFVICTIFTRNPPLAATRNASTTRTIVMPTSGWVVSKPAAHRRQYAYLGIYAFLLSVHVVSYYCASDLPKFVICAIFTRNSPLAATRNASTTTTMVMESNAVAKPAAYRRQYFSIFCQLSWLYLKSTAKTR